MESLVYRNTRGESINFGEDIGLMELDGIGDVEMDHQTFQSPFQDGLTWARGNLRERMITVKFVIEGINYADVRAKRQFLSRVLNPTLGLGFLEYRSTDRREIKAIANSVPFFPDGPDNRSSTFQKGLISFLCPNPYWLDAEISEQLVIWEGGLTFPLKLPSTFATQSLDKSKILLNNGDVETPVSIVFSGPAVAPIRIINVTTGDYIEVNQDLLDGEQLHIQTEYGNKQVWKINSDGRKENAFHYIREDSTLFSLIPGNNRIDYSTGAEYERAAVLISFRNRYLSV